MESVIHYYCLVNDRQDDRINKVHQNVGIGTLLFSRSLQISETVASKSGALAAALTGPVDASSMQVLDLSTLNAWLCNAQRLMTNRYTTATDVLNEWKCIGGLRGDVNSNGRVGHSHSRANATRGRIVNIGVGKRCLINDEWSAFSNGGGIVDSVPLYFVVRRVNLQTCKELMQSVSLGKRDNAGQSCMSAKFDADWHYPYMFVPYADSSHHVPRPEDLLNEPKYQNDEFDDWDEVTKKRECFGTDPPLYGEAHRIGLLTEPIASLDSTQWQSNIHSQGSAIPKTPCEVYLGC
jgi:hypothetical protein